jgi:hypothetical protein
MSNTTIIKTSLLAFILLTPTYYISYLCFTNVPYVVNFMAVLTLRSINLMGIKQ